MVTFDSLIKRKDKIAVLGLGYVGLPLAVHLSRHFDVLGYDLQAERIDELRSGIDRTLEVTKTDLKKSSILFSDNPQCLSDYRLIIVAVPTPIDEFRIPDLNPLRTASAATGRHMVKGSCIVFESTVYPGVTEEVCLPILESESGMTLKKDFTLGYSPERINPGDKIHTIDKVMKIVSGSDSRTCRMLSRVYGKIVKAGIHEASSIKVAEAAKVIENTQRDLNIALMNELALIFDRLKIDTREVLEAAGTKWNFLSFEPGLVGGHCIGVDPYYLTFKAESLGYHPEMILAGRRINDNMGKYIAERLVKLLIRSGRQVRGSKIAVLGITFKENVPDLRNTKVVDIVRELEDYGINVKVHDPLASENEARQYYNIDLCPMEAIKGVDAVILAVKHNYYQKMGLSKIAGLCRNSEPVIADIKGAFSPRQAEKMNITLWRL
jgi:UDP-N-acetyl-D-glucosamine/UDP-N-acetyl-D-galactosamine dehydrogenase